MKVGDLISWNFCDSPNLDDIGVIVSITDSGYFNSTVRIAWLREPGVREYHRASFKQDMALGVLAILRES